MNNSSKWEVWIDCEKVIASTFIGACKMIIKYVQSQACKKEECFDRVWIAYGDEIISLTVIEQIVKEENFAL